MPRGDVVYRRGDRAEDIQVVVLGQREARAGARAASRSRARCAAATCSAGPRCCRARASAWRRRLPERTELLQINGEQLIKVIGADPSVGNVVMSRFATMITREFTRPTLLARLRHPAEDAGARRGRAEPWG